MTRTFSHPRWKPILIKQSFLSLPSLSSGNYWYAFCLWICLFWVFHRVGIMQYVTICFWPVSFSIVFSRFIRVTAWISISFLFRATIRLQGYYQIARIDHISFIHLLVIGHLGCFLLSITVNSADMKFCVPVFVWTLVFNSFGRMPRNGILYTYFNFLFFLTQKIFSVDAFVLGIFSLKKISWKSLHICT